MKIIVTYEHEHETKSISEMTMCVEGPSVETVRTALRDLIEGTREEQLLFCGQKLDARDFRQPIHPKRLEHARMLAKHLNKPAPTVFDINGELHTFKKFRVQSLEDWFERNTCIFHKPAELALVH